MNRRWFFPSVLLVFLMTLFTAQACGPNFYPDVFVRKICPDNPNNFSGGKLGVLLPTYPRADLTVAFRYLNGGSLTATEQKAYQPIFDYTDPEWNKPWDPASVNEKKQADPAGLWSAARARFATLAPKVETNASVEVKLPNGVTFHKNYSNCLGDAFSTATETLQSRAKTWGEKSPELADWLKGQDAVFANCPAPASLLPSDAPPGSSALLKADRAYQIAAARFYSGQYDDARKAFEAIARDSSSPWQGKARFLVARCLVRQAFSSKPGINSDQMATFDSDLMRQAVTYLESLLKEKPQGISRQAIQDLLDLARLRSEPMAQLHLLSTALAGPKTDSRYDQHLKDLTWYLNARLDQLPLREDADLTTIETDSSKPFSRPTQAQKDDAFNKTYNNLAELRSSALLVDWLITFQSPASEAKDHAIAEWKQTRQLYWLLAAITKATEKDAEAAALVTAAAQIKPDSPAWESISYHRLRLLLALGRAQEARTLLDQILPQIRAGGRDSSLSLFLGLRMRASTNLNEALAYAPRKVLVRASESNSALNECLDVMKNPQRKYDCKKEVNTLQFSDDAAAFFNTQAPLSILIEAAGSDALPMQLRQSVAMMAWVRSVLLHDDAAAAKLFPLLPQKLQQQAGSGTGFHALVTLLRNPGLRPYLDSGIQRNYSYDFVESYRDNWWYRDLAVNDYGYNPPSLEKYSVAFLTPALQADEKREIAALIKLGGAQTALGERAIAYANDHPADPDVPESLYLVLRMIRYSREEYRFLDPSAEQQPVSKAQSIQQAAARILRQRYPASSWTKKAAPYVSAG
jgi:hypothetical protein